MILALDNDETECVLMGRGIGFSKSKGDFIDSEGIEKIFSLSSSEMNRSWAEYLSTISETQYKVTQEIVEFAENHLKRKLDDYIYLSLTDHIEFALERSEKGLVISNPLAWEIQNVYPEEYRVALEALQIVQDHYDLRLSHEEAPSIALHIINASEDSSTLEELASDLNLISDILKIVGAHFSIDFNRPSITFERFILHLKFFSWRLKSGHPPYKDTDDLYPMLAEKWPETDACIEDILSMLESTRNITVDKHEAFYLMLHINRLRMRNEINT